MKLKRKSKIFIIVMVVLLIILLIGGYLFYRHKKEEKEKMISIKEHYSSTVLMNSGSIYQKENDQYQKVGAVEKNTLFSLAEFSIDDVNDTYFPISNSNYYVYFEEVSPTEEKLKRDYPDYYLLKTQVGSTENTKFYQNGELLFTLDQSLTFDVISKTEDYYQVKFMDQFFDLKQSEVEIKEEKELEETTLISVIEVPEINEDCTNNNCISSSKLKTVLDHFIEKGKYTITKDDFALWLHGNIHLKTGAVLFLSEKLDGIEALFQEKNYVVQEKGDYTLLRNNTAAKVNDQVNYLSSYELSMNTSDENLEKMIHNETIVPPKKVAVASPKTLPSLNAKATNIAVLNYHFFYANGESCGSSICLNIDRFREQLEFLKQNQYKTLTMEEYRAWMYGEIELPARSVLITVDDGAMGTGRHNGNKLIPLLEEYHMHATLFLISGWWAKDNYISNYLDIESHTHDMHTEGFCSGVTRGAQLLCSSKEQVLADLKLSIATIGSSTAFCFPFYAYNNEAIASIKEVGFKLAFVGGNVKSNRGNDKYKIPRYPIYDNTSLNEFINMIA